MNAKERMKAYLEKLRNMEPDEIVELKARYNKFSESYDNLNSNMFSNVLIDNDYFFIEKPKGKSNIFSELNFDNNFLVAIKEEKKEEIVLAA